MIKSYTDIEQSSKLAEILSFESADMLFQLGEDKYADSIRVSLTKEHWEQIMPDIKPCWSLAALLELIPKEINALGTIYSINIRPKNEKWFIDYKCNNEEFVGVYSNIFLDACVEIIIKLHERNLL